MYLERRIISGPILEIERSACSQYGKVIGGRKRIGETGEKQAEGNRKRAKRRFIRLLNCNFKKGDWHLIPTFAEIPTEAMAKNFFGRFLRNFNNYCIRHNLPKLKYMWVMEHGETGRPHFHIVIPKMNISINEISQLWGHGIVKLETLDGDTSYEWLARYLEKEWQEQDERKIKNARHWGASRNLAQPIETEPKILKRKNLNKKPQLPKEYFLLDYRHGANAFGWEYEYIIAIRYDRKHELPMDMQKLMEEGVA